MGCNCFNVANGVTVSDTNVTLTFISPVVLTDERPFCFRLATMIPEAGATLPVLVTVNGTAIPLLNKYGNPVVGADLRVRRLYKGYYGATTPHVIIHNLPLYLGCGCQRGL
jgi:hypothetical protein